MNLTSTQLIGAALLAPPFIAIAIFMLREGGLGMCLAVLGICAVTVAVITVGVILLFPAKNQIPPPGMHTPSPSAATSPAADKDFYGHGDMPKR